MHKYYPLLFSPLKIGDKVVKNRICSSALSIAGAYDAGGLTQRGIAYYLERAKGGCGIVTLSETQASGDFYRAPEPGAIAAYRVLTEMMRNYGALSSIELGIRDENYAGENELADAYARASEICLDCGFDMISIHGGLSRIPVLDRVRERVGRKLLIEYRISAGEVIDGRVRIDEMTKFSRLLESRVDIIHASSTHLDPWRRAFTSIYHETGVNLGLSAAIKQAVNIPVAAIGGLNTPETAEKALENGQADLLSFGRQMLADPHFAMKAERGEMEEINTCIRCMCCHSAPDSAAYCGCTVNPAGGKEYIAGAVKPLTRRTVLVIGGGPAGMSAANRAFDCGARVILLEKSGSLGGALKYAAQDAYKGDLRLFRDNLIARTLRKAIDVRFNTAATPERVAGIEADLVVCAVGAERVRPPIPGLELAVHAADVYEANLETLGERVLIVGGGLAGCELAMHLSVAGKSVTVLEMGPQLAPDAYRMHRVWLLRRLERAAACHVNTRCVRISADGAAAIGADGSELSFPADTVAYALGTRAKSELVETLRRSVPGSFIAVGDCRRAAKVKEAVNQGYFAVDLLD